MEKIKITAQAREKAGVRGELSKIRAQKMIPAVIYGAGEEPVSISFSQKDLAAIQKAGSNTLVEIDLGKKKEPAIIKEVQYHVVSDLPIHVDFQRVSMNKAIETLVPVILVGESAAVKMHGGIVDHAVREVKVKCLPADIPHHIDADITELSLEKHICVSDLKAPKGVEFVDEPTKMIVHVIIPRDEAVAAPAAAATDATAAQPELSATKGKKEEEGAAAGAAPAKK